MINFCDMSESQRMDLKDIVSTLYRDGCILKNPIDAKTGTVRENKKYTTCDILQDYVRAYLEIMGVNLIHEPGFELFYLQSNGSRGQAMTKELTYLLFILRLIYGEKQKEAGLEKVRTTKAEIRRKGVDTGLISEAMRLRDWNANLQALRRKNVLAYDGATDNLRDDAPIYIQDMILLYMSQARLTVIEQSIQKEENNETGYLTA